MMLCDRSCCWVVAVTHEHARGHGTLLHSLTHRQYTDAWPVCVATLKAGVSLTSHASRHSNGREYGVYIWMMLSDLSCCWVVAVTHEHAREHGTLLHSLTHRRN